MRSPLKSASGDGQSDVFFLRGTDTSGEVVLSGCGGESFIASTICCRSKLLDLSASCRAAIFDSRAETRSSSSAISEGGITNLTGVGEEGGVSNGAFAEESEDSEFAP